MKTLLEAVKEFKEAREKVDIDLMNAAIRLFDLERISIKAGNEADKKETYRNEFMNVYDNLEVNGEILDGDTLSNWKDDEHFYKEFHHKKAYFEKQIEQGYFFLHGYIANNRHVKTRMKFLSGLDYYKVKEL